MFNLHKETGSKPLIENSPSGISTIRSARKDHSRFELGCKSSVAFMPLRISKCVTKFYLCRFFSRNLPYSALIRILGGHADDTPSPLSRSPQTPAYLTVSSPQEPPRWC